MSTNIEDNKVLKMQKFVSQPTEPGHILPYCVAVWNATANNYIPLKGEEYATEDEAKERARHLNEEHSEFNVTRKVFSLFINSRLKDFVSIERELTWRYNDRYIRFDLVLKLHSLPFVVVEIVRKVEAAHLTNAQKYIDVAFKVSPCRYGVITDGETFLLKTNVAKSNYESVTFSQMEEILVSQLRAPLSEIKHNQNQNQNIQDLLNKYGLGNFIEKIQYDNQLNVYAFDSSEQEEEFFKAIASDLFESVTKVYRYVPLRTAIEIFKSCKIRLNGVVGMNDPSEIDYFDKYVSIKNAEVPNDTYVLSCSILKDDLTMWRLYGDDGKGVYLEFQSNEKQCEGFRFCKVHYAETSRQNKALTIIKALCKSGVQFKTLERWKHFFKPFEYKTEEEFRVIFDSKEKPKVQKQWILTDNYSIINSFVEFDLKFFPLTLSKVILGPKCPEQALNKIQLKELLTDKNIVVGKSKITNYR